MSTVTTAEPKQIITGLDVQGIEDGTEIEWDVAYELFFQLPQEESMNEKYYLYEVTIVNPMTFKVTAKKIVSRSEQDAVFQVFRDVDPEGSIDDYDVCTTQIMAVRNLKEE